MLTAESWQKFKDRLFDQKAQQAYELMQLSTIGVIPHDEFISELATLSGKTESEVEQDLRNDDHKNTDLLEYIKELKQQGLKIGLLSNVGNNWIREEFLTAEEQALFDDMVMSFEVGMNKPDPRIYQLACERLGVQPKESVFIDDIERYCVAAEAEGLQAILYTDLHSMKQKLTGILQKNR